MVHSFIYDAADASYKASGKVDGTVLNSYSMSEHEGALRVATTSSDPNTGRTESGVYVLKPSGDELNVVGSVTGLGKTERIYAVRFMGPTGYVVTFRQTDPLYVLDLRDPASPKVTGELKIPGYSAYLHPVGDGRLLGLGQDATDTGRVTGSQLSLFDVSDPTKPTRISQVDLGQGGSEAEHDPHAFLFWAKTGQIVVPFQSCCTRDGMPTSGAIVTKLADDTLAMQGAISTNGTNADPSVCEMNEPCPPTGRPELVWQPFQRSMVVNDRLVLLNGYLVQVVDMTNLATITRIELI